MKSDARPGTLTEDVDSLFISEEESKEPNFEILPYQPRVRKPVFLQFMITLFCVCLVFFFVLLSFTYLPGTKKLAHKMIQMPLRVPASFYIRR